MSKRKKIKHSIFGSFEEVRKQNACEHDWEWVYGIIWGYLEVDWRCTKCGTFKGPEKSNQAICPLKK